MKKQQYFCLLFLVLSVSGTIFTLYATMSVTGLMFTVMHLLALLLLGSTTFFYIAYKVFSVRSEQTEEKIIQARIAEYEMLTRSIVNA